MSFSASIASYSRSLTWSRKQSIEHEMRMNSLEILSCRCHIVKLPMPCVEDFSLNAPTNPAIFCMWGITSLLHFRRSASLNLIALPSFMDDSCCLRDLKLDMART